MNRTEAGNVHVVTVGTIMVALIVGIGLLFLQNILKPAQDSTTVVKQASSPSPSVAALKTFCAPIEKLCFDYPSDWTVKADDISAESQALAEQFTIADQAGQPWLRLQTGMTGLGGTCGNEPNSYSKILKSHKTKVAGSYLVNEVAKDYMVDTAYAVESVDYYPNITDSKNYWTVHMVLNDSKAAQTVGQVGVCDLGLSIINGKNAKAEGMNQAGAVSFDYYGDTTDYKQYATETEAMAVLSSGSADKAFTILASARYK